MKRMRKRVVTDIEDRQKWTLNTKIEYSLDKIREWYDYYDGNVHVMFSGGKDSTVLLHLCRAIYPDIPAVLSNTGLEYPEIISFAKSIPNITYLKPRKHFRAVINEYGYPVISKQVAEYVEQIRNNIEKMCSQVVRLRLIGMTAKNEFRQQFMLSGKWQFLIDAPFKISARCCKYMKKYPAWDYEKKTGSVPILGTMAADSSIRKAAYAFSGCNAYEAEHPRSAPLSIWTENDIWKYIKMTGIKYSEIYDMGYKNTGCVFCMFGIHKDKINRFTKMKQTHPKLYKYCMEKLGLHKVLRFIGFEAE